MMKGGSCEGCAEMVAAAAGRRRRRLLVPNSDDSVKMTGSFMAYEPRLPVPVGAFESLRIPFPNNNNNNNVSRSRKRHASHGRPWALYVVQVLKGLVGKVTKCANGRRNALGQNGPEWP
jgi:hypothetical protein